MPPPRRWPMEDLKIAGVIILGIVMWFVGDVILNPKR